MNAYFLCQTSHNVIDILKFDFQKDYLRISVLLVVCRYKRLLEETDRQ